MLRSQYAGSLYSEVIVRFLPPLKVVGFLALLFVNGTAKWKDPDGGKTILVVVDEIASPEVVECHYLDGKGEVECPWEELSAA